MDFWNVLKKTGEVAVKVGSVALDTVVKIAEKQANKIDKMSDSEIEKNLISKNPDYSVNDYRDFAKKAHDLSRQRKKDSDDKTQHE